MESSNPKVSIFNSALNSCGDSTAEECVLSKKKRELNVK